MRRRVFSLGLAAAALADGKAFADVFAPPAAGSLLAVGDPVTQHAQLFAGYQGMRISQSNGRIFQAARR